MKTLKLCLVFLFLGSAAACQCGAPSVQRKSQSQAEIAERQKTEPNYVGTVKVIVVVTESGHVCGIAVSQSTGKETDKLAVDTLKKWKFSPAMKDGKPVIVMVEIAVDLMLDSKTGQLSVKQASGPAQKS